MNDFPVSVPILVHWGDMDALGHVNNARYFTWFESARIALFERVGLAAVGTPAVGPILASTRCDFLAPVRYPAELVAGSSVERLGNTSFTMGYGIAHAAEPDHLVARGEGVVVLIDYATGAKVPIPDDLRAALSSFTPGADR